MAETSDNSMASEENIRRVSLNSNQQDPSPVTLNWPHPLCASRQNLILELSDNLGAISSEENSTESNSLELGGPSNTSDVTAGSSESTSSESNETSEASDSAESNQIRAPDCVNGTASCESEEYFLQGIGDDGQAAVDHLMVPDDDERELSLRWSLLQALCDTSMNYTTWSKNSPWH